jgi:hypothetical protein
VLVAAQLVVWVANAIEDRRTPPPVKAARTFLAALSNAARKDGEACERALSHLTASRRAMFEAQARSGYRWRASPCGTAAAHSFLGLQPNTVRLASQTSGRATVSIDRQKADPKSFLVPGFWPTRYIVTTAEMQLIKETGSWKVVGP